jgi:hypothetical protein
MDWYVSEYEATRRHSELLNEAQVNRQLHPHHNGGQHGSRGRVMYRLGSLLVESGRRLQTQYK